jgi:hypothetical protein
VFKLFINLFHALVFYCGVSFTKMKGWWRPRTQQRQKVKITKMALKAGDSYRLGECIVTLAQFGIAGKKEVAAKIEAVNKLRELRERQLTERGQKIMLLSPEELKKFEIDEWLKQRKSFNEKKFYENLK